MIIKCPECGKEISDKASACPGCGCPRDVWAGETKGERIATPSCGTVRNDMAVREADPYGGSGRQVAAPTDAGEERQAVRKGQKPPTTDAGEKKSGCLGWGLKILGAVFGLFLLTLVVTILVTANNKEKSNASYQSSYSGSTASGGESKADQVKRLLEEDKKKDAVWSAAGYQTPKPSMPSTTQFGDDAEIIVKEIKETLGDYKYSWTANGYRLTLTVRVESITGDDLAELYAYDPSGTQSLMDRLNGAVQEANESTWERFKNLGYADCTIVFSMVTNDDMVISICTNGKITQSITKDNFRLG